MQSSATKPDDGVKAETLYARIQIGIAQTDENHLNAGAPLRQKYFKFRLILQYLGSHISILRHGIAYAGTDIRRVAHHILLSLHHQIIAADVFVKANGSSNVIGIIP